MAQTPVIGIPTPDEYMIGRTVAGYMRYCHADEQDALCSHRDRQQHMRRQVADNKEHKGYPLGRRLCTYAMA